MRAIISRRSIRKKIRSMQKNAAGQGITLDVLMQYNNIFTNNQGKKAPNKSIILTTIAIFICVVISSIFYNSILSLRCLVPNNFIVWEVTRPIADCAYCINVTAPIILRNVSRRDFEYYAYSSRPIILKKMINDWKAAKDFSFAFFKRLYLHTAGSFESLDEGCQFLNFKTDLFSLEEVFQMSEARARNEPGQKPWYVGWGNCHPDILAKVRQYYNIPDFLPEDAEYPATENIFFGYEIGAVMHLDYIPRLMWQGQIKGSKTWSLAPVPECDHLCNKYQFYVETGDIVLLDTRIWYHATSIPKGELSITVQSEYG